MKNLALTATLIALAAALLGFTSRLSDHPQEAWVQGEPTSSSSAATVQVSSADGRTRTELDATWAPLDHGGYYAAPVGAQMTFDLDHATRIEFRSETTTMVGVHVEGRDVVTVVARRDEELVARHDLDVEVTLEGGISGEAERLTAALASPTFVHMRNDGTLLGVAFAEEMPRRARDTVRALLVAFRARAEEGDRWTSEVIDLNGTATFEDRWTDRRGRGGAIQRTRAGLVSHEAFDAVGGSPEPVGRTIAEIDASIGWLSRVSFAETVRHAQEELIEIVGSAEGEFLLTKTDDVDVTPLLPDAVQVWSLDWRSLMAPTERAHRGADDDLQVRQWRVRLEGVTLDALAAELERIAARTPIDASKLRDVAAHIEWLLRLEPARVSEMLPLIEGAGDRTARALLRGVGSVGTPECQALLTGLALDRGRNSELRVASLEALTRVDAPSGEAVEAVLDLVAAGDATEVGQLSMMLAGAFASRSDAESDRIVAALVAAAPQSTDTQGVCAWLGGMGNAHEPAVADVVRPHMDSPDEAVRRAAVDAFVRSVGEEALPELAQRLEADASPRVRAACVRAIGTCPNADLGVIQGLFQRDEDQRVRTTALYSLAERVNENEVRQFLEGVGASTTDVRLREIALDLLSD